MSIERSDDDLLAAVTDAAEKLGMRVGPVIVPDEAMQAEAKARMEAKERAIRDASGNVPRALVEFNPLSRQRNNRWSNEQTDPLWLLTTAEYDLLPDGVTLVCISGKTGVKGIDYIDQDTRAGYIAWGLLDSQLPPMHPTEERRDV